ncbi:MAG: inositol monophosphatase family protein [Solirubrobacteraceae bacterium]
MSGRFAGKPSGGESSAGGPSRGGASARASSAGEPREDSSTAELLQVAVDTATTAGLLLLERFNGGRERDVESKSTPTDLVSEADRLAQRCIREELALRRPRDGFLGEEEGGEEAGRSGLRWVVDPLDGTVNFLFGLPQWCVSVAAQDERGSLVGAIYDPIREELFTAVRGGEARMRTPAKESPVDSPPTAGEPRRFEELTLQGSGREDLPTAMVATGFAYDARVRAAQAQVLARAIPRVRDIRRFGSAALDLAWTAAGRYDAYFERTVKPWDIAAGTVLCEAAGLRVVELPEHEDLPWGILVAPPALCEPLLELVGGPA